MRNSNIALGLLRAANCLPVPCIFWIERGMRKNHSEIRSAMHYLLGAIVVAWTLLACPAMAAAVDHYRLAMDQVHWSISRGRFQCQLELPLEKFGTLRFSHAAGADLELIYAPVAPDFGRVEIALATPPWMPAETSQGQVLQAEERQFRLPGPDSRAIFNALRQGLWLNLKIDNRFLSIPSVGWIDKAEPFEDCEQRLPPMSVRQARDQVLYYQVGQRVLSEKQLEMLETLAKYIKADNKVQRVLIDAYTDNLGSRAANLQISRERAADVAAALRSAGVPAAIIEQRAHGDRYPVADNNTSTGRDLNRKVTLRIIRHDSEK